MLSAAPAVQETSSAVTPESVDVAEGNFRQATPTEAFITYIVKEGDDFTSIAERYDVDVDELIALNGFTIDQPLGAGEVLRIPYRPTPVPEGAVVIKNIIGVGDLDTERVLIKFVGEGELSLVGWQIEGQNGNIYLFPETPRLTLFADGAVYVFTKPGVNSAIELFWGKDAPVWSSGETVILKDAAGTVRASYQIP
jgi:LysM repeat protein